MRIVTAAAFGAGFVLGARAGRARYDQLMILARRAGVTFEGIELDGGAVRDRLDDYTSRLEEYASRGDGRDMGQKSRAASRG